VSSSNILEMHCAEKHPNRRWVVVTSFWTCTSVGSIWLRPPRVKIRVWAGTFKLTAQDSLAIRRLVYTLERSIDALILSCSLNGSAAPSRSVDRFCTPCYSTGMVRRCIHPISIVLLVMAQAAIAFSTPVGLMVCREADGTTHLELMGSGSCCDTVCLPAIHALECEENACDSSTEAHITCAWGSCIDEPLSLESATAHARRLIEGPQTLRYAVALDSPQSSAPDFVQGLFMPRVEVWYGPPLQNVHCLSTTVLMI